MRILIVAATQQEIEPLFKVGSGQWAVGISGSLAVDSAQLAEDNSEISADSSNFASPKQSTANCQLLITGVGMVATAFALGKHLAVNKYGLAINLGIAGSFDRSLRLGEVVEVTTDIMPEFGAEDGEDFLSIEQLGFGESVYNATTTLSSILNQLNINDTSLLLKQTTGITVNTIHGNVEQIRKITKRFNPQIESMEGAAFFYACREAGLPCIQIRAVSNYVERRNRDNWRIGIAIKNLNIFAGKLLQQLTQQS